jgi:hypothetical protein
MELYSQEKTEVLEKKNPLELELQDVRAKRNGGGFYVERPFLI